MYKRFIMIRRRCRPLSRRNNSGGLLQLQQLLPRPGGIQQLLVSSLCSKHLDDSFSRSYGDQYAEQGAQSSELVAKQEDGGLFSSVDRIFFGGQGLALPLAITLFLVDIVVSGMNKMWDNFDVKSISLKISAAFLLFPVTFEVEADNRRSWRSDDWSLSSRKRSKKRRKQRSVPAPLSLCSEEVAASEGVAGQMCGLMSAVISSVVIYPDAPSRHN